MSKLRLIFLIILIPIVFFQCDDDHPVPDVYVYERIDLNLPQYIELQTPGNSIKINGGYNGIIVTNVEGIDISGEIYAAYDATCTYDPEVSDVVIDKSNIFASCHTCDSRYNLLYGSVESGPAGLALKKYTTRYNPNQHLLIISN